MPPLRTMATTADCASRATPDSVDEEEERSAVELGEELMSGVGESIGAPPWLYSHSVRVMVPMFCKAAFVSVERRPHPLHAPTHVDD